jgi:hypothetical protein
MDFSSLPPIVQWGAVVGAGLASFLMVWLGLKAKTPIGDEDQELVRLRGEQAKLLAEQTMTKCRDMVEKYVHDNVDPRILVIDTDVRGIDRRVIKLEADFSAFGRSRSR